MYLFTSRLFSLYIFHTNVHNSSSLVPILRQFDPIRTLTPHFLTIHFNIILPYTLTSPTTIYNKEIPHQLMNTDQPSRLWWDRISLWVVYRSTLSHLT